MQLKKSLSHLWGIWNTFELLFSHFLDTLKPLKDTIGSLGRLSDRFETLFAAQCTFGAFGTLFTPLVTFEHLLELLSNLIGVLIDVDADDVLAGHHGEAEDARVGVVVILLQCCQMAKFDPFLSLDCARVEGVGAQSKERKGSNFAA